MIKRKWSYLHTYTIYTCMYRYIYSYMHIYNNKLSYNRVKLLISDLFWSCKNNSVGDADKLPHSVWKSWNHYHTHKINKHSKRIHRWGLYHVITTQSQTESRLSFVSRMNLSWWWSHNDYVFQVLHAVSLRPGPGGGVLGRGQLMR